MPASRNPFFIRTAEQAESDDQFLSLFSLTVLDILPENGSWDRFLPIELAPGTGKSTLLRLFTPTVLNRIAKARNQPEFRELTTKLTHIDVLDHDGVQLLGVLVNCKEDFNRLPDLGLDANDRNKLFWALLHSRLTLLLIRAVTQLAELSYPADVDTIKFEPRSDDVIHRPDSRIVCGKELFENAQAVEQEIISSLNSFTLSTPELPTDRRTIDVLQLLSTHHIVIDGRQLARHVLIMFDDAHFLDVSQRQMLSSELKRHDRRAFGSWMAMRLRALDPPDLVVEATNTNREQLAIKQYDHWAQTNMEKWLIDVGDRRARRAQRDVSSFAACLADSPVPEFADETLEAAADSERRRAMDLARPHGELYKNWLDFTENDTRLLPPLEQTIRWAQLQIFLERRIRRIQGEFNLGSLSPIQINGLGIDTIEPATMFISRRNDLPYFYGIRRVIQTASSNVDQFLSLAALLFDQLLNTGNLSRYRTDQLSTVEQDRLIKTQSRSYIANLGTTLPYGQDVFNLVSAMAELCREESLQPNVPITPGVTGISIQISERNALIADARASQVQAKRLLNALGSAIAHNVLSIRITDRQRDENRAVFYLNRLICPAYDLPLGYGGYKRQPLSRLYDWVVTGKYSRQRGFTMS